MERFMWKGRLKPGMKAEYIKRHDEIWPEMTALLNESGIHNYTIWSFGDELYGYYEADKGTAFASATQSESPVVAKWNEYMKDMMAKDIDPTTGKPCALEQVFLHP